MKIKVINSLLLHTSITYNLALICSKTNYFENTFHNLKSVFEAFSNFFGSNLNFLISEWYPAIGQQIGF